ncbi:MAG: nucleotidyl transferase AbiEii/AbiGii toxin family protein [Deltaproteobacteria bacterium]|nr:nucleotidyl transferase AbiEii/AbiGii toxin family protein [Deltaproteobacteria bacterium]
MTPEPRFTHDIDIAVAVADDAEAESTTHALLRRGWRVGDVIEQSYTDRLATVRLALPAIDGPHVVDLLFATCGIEPEIVAAAQMLEVLPDLRVAVARPEFLVAMKLLSVDAERPQDAMDLHALHAVMDAEARERVGALVRLIAARGAARGRDLSAAWRVWSSTGFAPPPPPAR